MLTVVSPAKSLDFKSRVRTRKFSQPRFLEDAARLVEHMKTLDPDDLSELMDINPELAELNWQRYASWETPFSLRNARQAVFAFRGDVYLGLQAERFGTAELNFAQKHLRILSGLYGLLRPLDLIQPYRLEMGRQVAVDGHSGLYDFWGSRLAESLNEDLAAQPQKRKLLVNLASNEYFESVDERALEADVITPVFKDQTARGDYRVLSFLAKRARGEMAAWIIRNRVNAAHALKKFDENGYRYNAGESTADRLVFLRDRAP